MSVTHPTSPPPPAGPYPAAALTYFTNGWTPLPLPARSKTPVPTGWTGARGATPSGADIHAWTEDHPHGNIALRLPPHIIGIDVDNYDAKPGGLVLTDLETQLGALPPTWRTTSRDDGVSGIRFYRIPTGLRWPGGMGPGIDTIRWDHRYALAWPSIHPNGGTYRWITPDGIVAATTIPHPDDLPDLPHAWIEHFTKGEAATDQPHAGLDTTAATGWLATRGQGAPCPHTQRALTRGLTDLATTPDGGRHDAALRLTNRLAWLAADGHTGTITALQQAGAAFLAATAGARRHGDAEAEWDRMVTGAVDIAAGRGTTPTPDPCTDATHGGLIIPTTTQENPCPTPASTTKTDTPSSTTSTASPPPSSASPTSTPTPPTANDSAQGSPAPSTDPTSSADDADAERVTWARLDLTAYLDGTHTQLEPTLFPRDDGICLMYPGMTHSFHGESESGKSMVLQYECARLIRDGHDVLYLDFEADGGSVTERLLLFGATPTQILDHFDYRSPEVSPTATVADLQAWTDLLDRSYTLAVVDGVTDSLGIFGLSTKDNDDITKWTRILPRQIARRTGAAVAVVDHVTKDTENRGRFAIGGQAKMNAITGAAYTVEIVDPLGKGLKGTIVIRVGKDRHGFIRGHSAPMRPDRTQETARVVIDSTGAHIDVTITATTGAEIPRGERPPMRFTGVMEKTSKVLENADGPLSTRSLRELVGGNKDRLASALGDLLRDGYIAVEEGTRGATMHRLVRNYRQRNDPRSDIFDPLDPASIEAMEATNTRPWPTVADRGPTVAGPRSKATVADRGSSPYVVGLEDGHRGHGQSTSENNDRGSGQRIVNRVVAGNQVLVNLDTGNIVQRDETTGELIDTRTGEVVTP